MSYQIEEDDIYIKTIWRESNGRESNGRESNVKKNKKIHFDQTVSAILIPSIKDMGPEIIKELWWTKVDYILFSVSANKEIAAFLKEYTELTRKDAIRLLYDHSIVYFLEK